MSLTKENYLHRCQDEKDTGNAIKTKVQENQIRGTSSSDIKIIGFEDKQETRPGNPRKASKEQDQGTRGRQARNKTGEPDEGKQGTRPGNPRKDGARPGNPRKASREQDQGIRGRKARNTTGEAEEQDRRTRDRKARNTTGEPSKDRGTQGTRPGSPGKALKQTKTRELGKA